MSATPEHEAGRALDAEIAQRVFGLTYTERREEWRGPAPHRGPGVWLWYDYSDPLPEFSTEIAAAWRIVEHFQDAGFFIELSGAQHRRGYWARFWRTRMDRATNDTREIYADAMPLAICRAALAFADVC